MQQYRAFIDQAKECRKRAELATTEDAKQQYLELAEQWDELARARWEIIKPYK